MARVTAVHRPADYPGPVDEATAQALAELFAHVCPGAREPEIDQSHAGIAIAALNPKLALQLAKLSGFIAGELPWCRRRDLRELAMQVVNLHFGCDYAFRVRLPAAQAAGIGAALLAALPAWRSSALFDAEQRLVIEYTQAVVTGAVPAELFARVVERYGEKGAVEFTTLAAFWSFWAMLLNATRPEPEPGA